MSDSRKLTQEETDYRSELMESTPWPEELLEFVNGYGGPFCGDVVHGLITDWIIEQRADKQTGSGSGSRSGSTA